MKIDIVQDPNSAIQNYKPITISNGNIDFFEVSDSECTEVRANGVIDQFPAKNLESNFLNLLKKVRIGGKLFVSGIDCNILSRQLMSGQIDEKTFSNVVASCNSMSSLKSTAAIIKQSGFSIEAQNISGSTYEIMARRG